VPSTRPIITLLTDFGYKDHYVAAMKGVILSIARDAVIVDISHGVPKFDVRAASYILKCAYKYFPRNTIHVAVVDPGVGTGRRGVVVRTRNYVFVGPDNGLLVLAAKEDGIEEVRAIENRRLMLHPISYTFHGRDVFSPVAAHLALGVPLSEVGPRVESLTEPEFTRPVVEQGVLKCEVLHIDDFGNVVLNATRSDLANAGLEYGETCRVLLSRGVAIEAPLLPSYGYTERGSPLLLVNSEGHLELAVNMDSAARRFGVQVGDAVVIERV